MSCLKEACCSPHSQVTNDKKSLVIIGGGGAAFAAALKADPNDTQVTIINNGLPTGGTCVNVGCVPSKTLLRAAESMHLTKNHFLGIEYPAPKLNDFSALIEQKSSLVEELRQTKYLDVIKPHKHIQLIEGRAQFLDASTVTVRTDKSGVPLTFTGTYFLIATGATTFIPPISGIDTIDYLTNESAFDLKELPSSLIIIGGRYIALEVGQMFARFGTKVTILQRSSRILPTESADITDAVTKYLEDDGNIRIITGCYFKHVYRQVESDLVAVVIEVDGKEQTVSAPKLLLATGRTPNTQDLNLAAVGVQVNETGHVMVDDTLKTHTSNIFAAGDVIGDPEFVYSASYEGSLAAENALKGMNVKRDYTALPWVIFTDPQVAGVGMDDIQASQAGIEFETSTLPLESVPRCIAARDTRGFVKLIREKKTDLLIGARIVAPEGSELLMEVSLAIRYKIPVKDLANAFHPYLTLSEAIKLAAISFGKNVSTLSCCAA